jgi:hypothetical protein
MVIVPQPITPTIAAPPGQSPAPSAAAAVTPLPVAGYTSQNQVSIDMVNRNKQAEEGVLRILDMLAANPAVEQEWLAMGRRSIEQGFMFANRAIFKPERVKLAE